MKVSKKKPLVRVTASISDALLEELDRFVAQSHHKNRSLALSEIIRNRLLEDNVSTEQGEVIGTITLLFDHHKPHLQETLTSVQHDYQPQIISTLHVHVDHDNCLEVLVVRGKADIIKKIADELTTAKGVKHGKLTVTTTGKDLPS